MCTPRSFVRNALASLGMSRAVGAAAVLALNAALTAPAAAGFITIGATGPAAPSTSVAGAKYRLSTSNFDQSLDAGGGTGVSGNFISANLGNSTLNDRAYTFSLQNIVSEGLIFRMTFSEQTSTLAWGRFSSNPLLSGTGTSTTTINGRSAPTSFEAISVTARGDQSANSAMVIANLDFASALSENGTFSTMTANNTTGQPTQWLVAGPGVDLGSLNWVLSGTVTGAGATSSGETVRMVIDVRDIAVVPVPGALPMFVGGLFLALAFARRRRQS